MKQSLKTLIFFSLFNAALSEKELLHYAGDKLEKADPVLNQDGYLYLKSVDPEVFKRSRELEKKLWEKIKRYRFIFRICPFLKLVYVCNSLSFHACKPSSDIDLFMVTQKNRLFLSRFFLILLTQIFGVRRYGIKVSARFCLSFLIDETATDLSQLRIGPEDIYLRYWTSSLQMISGQQEDHEAFIRQNQNLLVNHNANPKYHLQHFDGKSSWIKKILECFFDFNFLENWAQSLQMKRIQKKYQDLDDPSETKISPNILKFHNKDSRAEIQKNYDQLVLSYEVHSNRSTLESKT